MRTLSQARHLGSPDEYFAWAVETARRIGRGSWEMIPPPTEVDASAAPYVAYANDGDWVADCPDGCGGAEVVEPGWPAMCCRCCNAGIGHRWRPVVWPKEKAAIEAALDARPADRNRNWGSPFLREKPESVADLRKDNARNLKGARGGGVGG